MKKTEIFYDELAKRAERDGTPWPPSALEREELAATLFGAKLVGCADVVILDPKDTANAFKEKATQATVTISGCEPKVLAIDSVEKNKAGVIGLFFRGAKEGDIPRGAMIAVS